MEGDTGDGDSAALLDGDTGNTGIESTLLDVSGEFHGKPSSHMDISTQLPVPKDSLEVSSLNLIQELVAEPVSPELEVEVVYQLASQRPHDHQSKLK